MSRRVAASFVGLGVVLVAAVACGGGGGSKQKLGAPAPFSQVRSLLNAKCGSCHPGVVSSLDLSAAHAYASMVGVQAIEDPALERVVAGDPTRSFLFLKVAGWPGNHGNPNVGARMPFGQGPLTAAQIDLLRRWILQGAKNTNGKTSSVNQVATPGNVSELAAAKVPQVTSGSGRIAGRVTDALHRPIVGAVVTLLLVRHDLPGGEEHYLAGVTDADGRYEIRGAPVGRVEIKAYAPGTVYVSRLLNTARGTITRGDVGLPHEAVSTTTTATPSVTKTGNHLDLALAVGGTQIDKNYTLAVNPESGRVFELHPPAGGAERPGRWTRAVPAHGLAGRWIFISVSHLCTVAPFRTVAAS